MEKDELPQKSLPIKIYDYKNDVERNYVANSAEWVGYMLISWVMADEIKGVDILKKYDIEAVISSYERLHCMSISAAINEIKNDFQKDKNLHSFENIDISVSK